jgi:hypothetical protein
MIDDDDGKEGRGRGIYILRVLLFEKRGKGCW